MTNRSRIRTLAAALIIGAALLPGAALGAAAVPSGPDLPPSAKPDTPPAPAPAPRHVAPAPAPTPAPAPRRRRLPRPARPRVTTSTSATTTPAPAGPTPAQIAAQRARQLRLAAARARAAALEARREALSGAATVAAVAKSTPRMGRELEAAVARNFPVALSTPEAPAPSSPGHSDGGSRSVLLTGVLALLLLGLAGSGFLLLRRLRVDAEPRAAGIVEILAERRAEIMVGLLACAVVAIVAWLIVNPSTLYG